jgi:hypothetical protein
MHAAKIIAHGGRARRPPPRTLQSPVAPSCCWRLSSRCRRGCRFCKVTEVGGCTSSPPLTFFNFIHDAFEQSSEAQTSSVTHSEPPSTHWLARACGAAGTPTAAAHQFDPLQGTTMPAAVNLALTPRAICPQLDPSALQTQRYGSAGRHPQRPVASARGL